MRPRLRASIGGRKSFVRRKHRLDVQPHHREILLDRDFVKLPALAVTGVVDEDIDGDAALLQLVENFLRGIRLLEVFRDHDRIRSPPAAFSCCATSRSSDSTGATSTTRVTMARELVREVQADATRSACDECRFVFMQRVRRPPGGWTRLLCHMRACDR